MDSGFSPSVIWGTTRRYKPMEGVSAWLDHRIRRDRRNGFIRRENAQCGTESAGFHLGRFEAKGIFWFVVAEGYFASHEPAMTMASRRVFDSFSTDIRCSFVRFSLVPRSVLDRSSID